jgi:hypothetical protein
MEEQNDNKSAANNEENQLPLTTQGDAAEKEENLGGTTNLSLDQLKEEGGIADFTEDNPDGISDPDDLREIRASDDLNEPDPEENLPPTGATPEDTKADDTEQNI